MSSRPAHHGGDRLFKVGIWLKGINGGLELIGAGLLVLIPASAFTKTILYLTQHDIGSGTKDWVFRQLSAGVSHLSGESGFAMFYLLSHGAVKVFLAVALLRDIRWAYPTALIVFGLLAGYEIFRFASHPGIMMGIIIAIDIAVIALIWRHWRSNRNEKGHPRHPRKHHARHASA